MPGRRPDEAVPRRNWVSVRLSEHDDEALDRMRGQKTRSAYVRELLASALANERQTDDP